MTEFLSLCDVLFNVVSLAGYFCDVVFDVVLSYALYERGHYTYMTVVIVLVIASLVISQVLHIERIRVGVDFVLIFVFEL